MKVRVLGVAPIPGTERFMVAIANRFERWTVEQIKTAIEDGLDVTLAHPWADQTGDPYERN